MFPFWYDLRSAFRTAGTASSDRMLGEFLSSLGTFHSVSLPGRGAGVEFVHSDDPVDPRRNLVGQVRDEEELHNYSFSFNPVPQVEVSIGQGLSAIGSSNEFVASRTRRTLVGNERSVGPFAAFAGRGLGMSLDWRWNENTAVDFTGKLGEGYFGSSSAQLASLGYSRQEIDLTPSGRERRLQLVYETGPGFGGDHVSLAIGGYVRVDPNHDADADTDVGVAAKILMDF